MLDSQNHFSILDNFTLGNPISEHHGVICYPAIKENTNKKYIVKIITVPANQAQFDALLIAGAYKDPSDAMEYFRSNGERILNEADFLNNLSKIEGFLPYDSWQMEPITRRRLGYEVCLVGSYKRSLDKYIRKNAITHLEAINLGLDLCAALSLCRQSGYLYTDLKPSNIFVSEKKEFRIGDLGFLSLDALRYASLPERYFSPYTPPELFDPMASMNMTVDTYAVGMILYQLYNDGQLPFIGFAPSEPLPNPCHADYEISEIIMKAIDPDPNQRWTDPKDLGKAIAAYMQRNSINDIPITPFIPVDVNPEDIVVLSPATPAEEKDASEANGSPDENSDHDEAAQLSEVQEQPASSDTERSHSESDSCAEQISPAPDTQSDPIEADPDAIDENPPICEAAESVNGIQQPMSETPDRDNISLEDVSEEVAKIVSKADDIIAHDIPKETVFPNQEQQTDPFAFVNDDQEEILDDYPMDPLMEDNTGSTKTDKKQKPKHYADSTRRNKILKFFSKCISVLLMAGICVCAVWYYQNVYLQTIDSISVSGSQNQITVLIDTNVDESKLIVQCTDENGKQRTSSVIGGKATFSDLEPSTQYNIQLSMSGFHALKGNTSEIFTTNATTQVVSFNAIAGSEDGSVLLEFAVDGLEPNFWNIRYVADGEEKRTETITTHSAMISGLTIGKVYTFTLDGGKDFDLGGSTSIEYLASRLILADNLTLTASNSSEVTVHWSSPGDVVVETWNVRIYDGYGFEEQITVTENHVVFTGIDPESRYTVEITASGMTHPATIMISSNPIILTEFKAEESTKNKLVLNWTHTGNTPEGGWLLHYTVDGAGDQSIPCEKLPAEITPLIPGANYNFVVEAANNRTVLNNRVSYQTKASENFSEFKFISENVTFGILKTPEDADWRTTPVNPESFTHTFAVGDSATLVLQSTTDVYLPSNKINCLFVFRDSYGNVLPDMTVENTYIWKEIWFEGDKKVGEIEIPRLPAIPGNYTMEIYFNGSFVTKTDIAITG